eukprot:m.60267 g.60267  ORF g.60267 m.60267 type:complete len:530 (-) comp19176_c0_seq2:46-1635(-)
MSIQARAIFAFEGDTSNGELVFQAGDMVEVLRQDIGEGWWEGIVNGETGLFPETYVELVDGDDIGSADDWDDDDDDDWDDQGHQDQHHDEEPDDDDEPHQAPVRSQPSNAARPTSSYGGMSDNFGRTETLKKGFNRFSAFVKAGAEGFLLGDTKDVTLDPNTLLHVLDSGTGIEWEPNTEQWQPIRVELAGTRSKFKGMKSYEAFNITGGISQGTVERRHKHFQWLHDRLSHKYSCVCIPPLPDKSYLPKYGESFLEKRRFKLEQFLNRVAQHPILSRDSLSLRHFLTCPNSDAAKWKAGKRKAEKDSVVQANFFKLICQDVPCPREADQTIEKFATFVKEMQASVKKSMDTSLAHADRMSGGFRREYKKVSASFMNLSECFAKEGSVGGDAVKLSMAINSMATTYDKIADLWGAQPVKDQIPFHDGLKEYMGLLHQFSDGVTSSKSATNAVIQLEETEQAKPQEIDVVRARADIIHTLTLAEMTHFNVSRRTDFKEYMREYLRSQIAFHEEIVSNLKGALQNFDELPF